MDFKLEQSTKKDHFHLTIKPRGLSPTTLLLERSELRHLIQIIDNNI